jgi:hypothetical protein
VGLDSRRQSWGISQKMQLALSGENDEDQPPGKLDLLPVAKI